MPETFENVRDESLKALSQWLESCRRKGKVARNTIATGIVVLDHLHRHCPVPRDEALSQGGEIKGARSGLGTILQRNGVPSSFLKEITTRQAHQDGQRLFQAFDWGKKLAALPKGEVSRLLVEMIAVLSTLAKEWLKRQNLKLQIDRRQAPSSWVQLIMENAKDRSGGVVEQHLVGAKLERRFKTQIPNYPAHAGDKQTARDGDFAVSRLVFHVTATPNRAVIQKCAANLVAGMHPVLLVRSDQETKAKALAEDEGIGTQLTLTSIENFVAFNIIELAATEEKEFFTILKEIVEIYNRRLGEVETDLSLQIEVQ